MIFTYLDTTVLPWLSDNLFFPSLSGAWKKGWGWWNLTVMGWVGVFSHSSLAALVFQSIVLFRLVLLALCGCLQMGSVVGLTVCSKSIVCPGWPALISVSPGAGEPFEVWLAFPLAFVLISRGLQFLGSLHVPLSDHTTLLQDGSLGLHGGTPHMRPTHSRVNAKSLQEWPLCSTFAGNLICYCTFPILGQTQKG